MTELRSHGTAFFGQIAGQPNFLGPTDCVLLIEGQRYMPLRLREQFVDPTPSDGTRALTTDSAVDLERIQTAVVAGTCEIHEVNGPPR